MNNGFSHKQCAPWQRRTVVGILVALLCIVFPLAKAHAQAPEGFSAPVGPAGGTLSVAEAALLLVIPPFALEQTVELTLETQTSAPADLPAGLSALGGWNLRSTAANPLPAGGFGEPWQATVHYGTCGTPDAPVFCASTPIDETSLHCLHRADESTGWVRMLGSADVLNGTLTCRDAGSGDYAIVAEPLQTSGATSDGPSITLLPLVRTAALH